MMEDKDMKRMKRLLATLMAALMLVSAAPVMAAPASETNGDYKLLALTFDDGPCKNTPRLLDGLAKLGAKATFFMVGQWIEQYPDIPARMVAEGHQIANHSYSHPTLTYSNVNYQLGKTRDLLVKYGGEQTYYVRAPYGADSARSAYNAPCIWVNLDISDYKRTDAAGMARDVIRIVKDGDIFLFHDTHSTSVDAALIAVEELQKQGYEFVTVSELFRRRGVVPQNGVRYSYVRNTGINLGPLEEEEEVDSEYFDESKLSEHWGYEAIEYVLEHGLFYGTDEGFLPNRKMTRAMFLTVLGRIAGVSPDAPASPPFSDVAAEHWAAPYIAWAAENWIIDPRPETFDLDGYITREEMAWVIYQYMRYAQLAGEVEEIALSYADVEEISPYIIDGVKYCASVSLLVGDELGFHPKDDTTRAQAATLFMRLNQFILAQKQPAPGEDAEPPSEGTDEEDPAGDGTPEGEAPEDEVPESPAPVEPGTE